MIKLIDRLEKSKTFWFLIIISLIFFFLRLPSLIEPYWYGDEGIYQVVGMAVNQGYMLYSDIWDNKPPLLYLTYALFHGDQYMARLASLIVGLFTLVVFFFLSQKLFQNLRASIITTVAFTLIFATPIIEGNIANAENFMLLPIILAALYVYKATETENKKLKNKKLFIAGFLVGIAFLFKIVALFDFAAFLVFLLILSLPENLKHVGVAVKKVTSVFFKETIFYVVGFIIPLLVTTLYFVLNNALADFIRAVFFGMVGYVSYGNQLLIPQGFLMLKLLILGVIIVLLLKKRHQLSKPTLLILLWTAFSLFNAFFSQRPYVHYMLVLVPSICLVLGLVVNAKTRKKQMYFGLLLLLILITVLTTFKTYSIKKTFAYYPNAVLFITGNKDITSYQRFFDGKTPRDYQLASFIKMHTNPDDRIFVWGDSAQIYSLSNKLPITRYTVAYHTRQSNEGFYETQKAIYEKNPKFVIILNEAPAFPFKLENYSGAFSLDRAVVYERDN